MAPQLGVIVTLNPAFAKYPWLIVLAVINSAISIYYYFKIIIAMYFSRDAGTNDIMTNIPIGVRWSMLLGLLLIALLTLVPGSVYALI